MRLSEIRKTQNDSKQPAYIKKNDITFKHSRMKASAIQGFRVLSGFMRWYPNIMKAPWHTMRTRKKHIDHENHESRNITCNSISTWETARYNALQPGRQNQPDTIRQNVLQTIIPAPELCVHHGLINMVRSTAQWWLAAWTEPRYMRLELVISAGKMQSM